MENEKQPNKLTFKKTTNVIAKTVKTANEQVKKIIELPAEALKELKINRNKSSEETGGSLKKITKTEAAEMDKIDELYKLTHQKNPYVAGTTPMLASIKEKEKIILPKGFPDKPIESAPPVEPSGPDSQ